MKKKWFTDKKEAQKEAGKRKLKCFKVGKRWFVGTDFQWLNL